MQRPKTFNEWKWKRWASNIIDRFDRLGNISDKEKVSKILEKNRSELILVREVYRQVHLARKSGQLVQQSCFCGDPKTEPHHEDYHKPLEVEWLCGHHHGIANQRRGKTKREQDRKEYQKYLKAFKKGLS